MNRGFRLRLLKKSPVDPPTPDNDLLLRAARRESTGRPPVWLMRQAGRFDPEYQRIRRECGLELEDLFRHAEKAAEITLLPVRLGVDAAILFQDILTPLTPAGAAFVFRPGPVLERPVESAADLDRLRSYDVHEHLPFVPQSIRGALNRLNGRVPLLGFAGAPLTLLTFVIGGGSPGADASKTKAMMAESPAAVHAALSLLAGVTADYLAMQAHAGVHAVQLFESCADLFTRAEYRTFALPYQRAAFSRVGGRIPTILFAKDQPDVDLMADSGATVISLGSGVDLAAAKERLGGRAAVQGNVDNVLLRDGTPEQVRRAVVACKEAGGASGHILNLGHGILKGTPFDNVVAFIGAAKS